MSANGVFLLSMWFCLSAARTVVWRRRTSIAVLDWKHMMGIIQIWVAVPAALDYSTVLGLVFVSIASKYAMLADVECGQVEATGHSRFNHNGQTVNTDPFCRPVKSQTQRYGWQGKHSCLNGIIQPALRRLTHNSGVLLAWLISAALFAICILLFNQVLACRRWCDSPCCFQCRDWDAVQCRLMRHLARGSDKVA